MRREVNTDRRARLPQVGLSRRARRVRESLEACGYNLRRAPHFRWEVCDAGWEHVETFGSLDEVLGFIAKSRQARSPF